MILGRFNGRKLDLHFASGAWTDAEINQLIEERVSARVRSQAVQRRLTMALIEAFAIMFIIITMGTSLADPDAKAVNFAFLFALLSLAVNLLLATITYASGWVFALLHLVRRA